MFEVITQNEYLYPYMSHRLKNDKQFMEHVISKNPRISAMIEKETIKEQRKKEEMQKEKLKMQIDREIQRKQQIREKKEKIKEEYEQQGENHPRLSLVNDFLQSNTSKRIFCQNRGVNVKDLEDALKEVEDIYPEIKQKIQEKNRQASASHLGTVENINRQLLSGKMTLIQYSREQYTGKKIYELLNVIDDGEDRRKLQTLIVNTIASGNLKMMDYVRLFSSEYDYNTVMRNINAFIKEVGKEIPEIQGKGKPINLAKIQIKRLEQYKKQYKSSDFVGTSIGFRDDNGDTKMVVVTNEHVEYAKKYLKSQKEYICYKTISDTISKLIKGEITQEKIEQMIEHKNAVSTLRKKEQEKQGLMLQQEQTEKEMKAAKALKEDYEKKVKQKLGMQNESQNADDNGKNDLNNNGDSESIDNEINNNDVTGER